ncbi:MAG: hypothetical protein KGJ40_00255 [candidate division NC10 bacterium]|nr:hypothetical protein [candidate division NC10 bacterium]
MSKRSAEWIDRLKRLRATLPEKADKTTEVTMEEMGHKGFRWAGIVVLVGGVIFSIYLYKSRFRYGLSRSLLVDLFLSFFLDSSVKLELKVGPEKIAEALRNFSSVFTVLLAFQSAVFLMLPLARKQLVPPKALCLGLFSMLCFFVGLFWTLINVEATLLGGVPIELWHFSFLMILLSTGTALTLFLIDAILTGSANSKRSDADGIQKGDTLEKNCR